MIHNNNSCPQSHNGLERFYVLLLWHRFVLVRKVGVQGIGALKGVGRRKDNQRIFYLKEIFNGATALRMKDPTPICYEEPSTLTFMSPFVNGFTVRVGLHVAVQEFEIHSTQRRVPVVFCVHHFPRQPSGTIKIHSKRPFYLKF